MIINFNDSLENALLETSKIIKSSLSKLIDNDGSELSRAMRYSSLLPSKNIRSYLCFSSALSISEEISDNIIILASVIELIHTYSLIHDDLPSMDDDDYRRGSLSCHKKFSESIAILAGNALLTRGFEVLSSKIFEVNHQCKIELINLISNIIGSKGMLEGQMMDMSFEKKTFVNHNDIETMILKKTALMFQLSCVGPLIIYEADQNYINLIKKFSLLIGKAFQIYDDLLDEFGSSKIIGKKTKKDKVRGKINFVSIMGKDEASNYLKKILLEAKEILNQSGEKDLRGFRLIFEYFEKHI